MFKLNNGINKRVTRDNMQLKTGVKLIIFITYVGLMVLFTGVLSMAFLGRSISLDAGVAFVILSVGVGLIGAADIIFNENLSTILSDINGVFAGQCVTATGCCVQ